uniref:Uncharacterized protein n=1 Tax=Rhizophora mucronata TaxID=61149 RepID=A0A2P2N483_RHIMU
MNKFEEVYKQTEEQIENYIGNLHSHGQLHNSSNLAAKKSVLVHEAHKL